MLLALLAGTAAAEPITPAQLGPRTVRFTYEMRVTPPPGTKLLEAWLPLPREEDQSVIDVHLSGTASTTVVRLFDSGDRAAYLRATPPGGVVTLTETATVRRREIRSGVGPLPARLEDIDAAAFAAELAPNGAVQINDEIRTIARRETRGKPTVVAQARALYDWVYDHMQYDKSVPGWGLGDIPYCLKVGKGNCTDFHTLSGNRILFTRSRDFLLGPDASAQRRNYFIYPIVRADGVDVPGVEWTFRYTDVAADTVASAR